MKDTEKIRDLHILIKCPNTRIIQETLYYNNIDRKKLIIHTGKISKKIEETIKSGRTFYNHKTPRFKDKYYYYLLKKYFNDIGIACNYKITSSGRSLSFFLDV
jgi:hypothetical protein